MGIGLEEAEDEQFGHLMDAFGTGTPPHGVVAIGIDRTVAIRRAPTIRDVIAFPKTASATDLMFRSPSEISAAQLCGAPSGDTGLRYSGREVCGAA